MLSSQNKMYKSDFGYRCREAFEIRQINKTVELSLAKVLTKSKVIIMGTTYTKSKYNSYSIRKVLQQACRDHQCQ
jgi:hypothetical protein